MAREECNERCERCLLIMSLIITRHFLALQQKLHMNSNKPEKNTHRTVRPMPNFSEVFEVLVKHKDAGCPLKMRSKKQLGIPQTLLPGQLLSPAICNTGHKQQRQQ
jgi:heterodisulfide reductase subunit C